MIQDSVLINDWHPVAFSSEVTSERPVAVRLLDVDLVVWRSDGVVCVWQDLCVHRGAKLSMGSIRANCLVCCYHGWTYDASGRCTAIPAHPTLEPPQRAQARTYRCQERYGLLWVCLGSPEQEVPVFQEWDDPAFRKIACGPYRIRANGPRIIENFLDVGHFPFVHEGLLGDAARPEIQDYEATIGPDGVIASDVRIWQPDPDGSSVASEVSYTYQVMRPLTAYFFKAHGDRRYSMINTVQPVSESDCVVRVILALNYSADVPDEELRLFQDRITAQDIPVVESQRPELLPLDLQEELHLRSDRTAIAYRQWLKQIGLTYGTA
jgi:phenylpropionate dioxygenase-like ring-hydroxylating dioxygenase large terminal subunit